MRMKSLVEEKGNLLRVAVFNRTTEPREEILALEFREVQESFRLIAA